MTPCATVSRPERGIFVFDDVLVNPRAYRAAALSASFETVHVGVAAFHGIALGLWDRELPNWIETQFPGVTATTSIFRQSPAGQVEPHFIHADLDMGDWTAIVYLNPAAPPEDGTSFWRLRDTGAIATTTTGREDQPSAEWALWRDRARWECWHTVPARFNRVLVFASPLFHSRAIEANYGAGADARLIQVVFGQGRVDACRSLSAQA
jgi:hypothetical protein